LRVISRELIITANRETAAADGNARRANMADFFPCRTKGANLRGLLNVKRLTSLV
jgi:hypothetical protein